MAEKLIFDVSSYQGLIDFDKLLSGDKDKPAAMIVRSGISWGYVDKHFVRNYNGIKSVGLPVTDYHVIRADAPAKQQVNAWLKLMELVKWDGKTSLIPDIELHNGKTKQQVTDVFFETCDYMISLGLNIVNYSARWFLDGYMIRHPRYADFYWMLAAYGLTDENGYREMLTSEFVDPKKKYIPLDIPVKKVVMHQFTDRFMNSSGKLYGMESEGLDASRWTGTDDEFELVFGKSGTVEEEHPKVVVGNQLSELGVMLTNVQTKLTEVIKGVGDL
jgi:GH25 family lysozyme M1 (1,4-beta-N-acetylmuramidase)